MLIADQRVVRDVKKADAQYQDGDDANLPLTCLQVIDRQDLDFTEQLWDVLRGDNILINLLTYQIVYN